MPSSSAMQQHTSSRARTPVGVARISKVRSGQLAARTRSSVPTVLCSLKASHPKEQTRVVSSPATSTLDAPTAAPPAHAPASPKAKTLGWKTLASQMVQPQVAAPRSIVAVTPFDVTFGQFMGTVLQSFYWPVAPPDAHALLLKSLSHTLSAYPTLCGRPLEGGKLDLNNAGVLVEFGTCTATLADLLPASPDTQLHTALDLSEFSPDATSPLTVCIAQQLPLLTIRIGTLADGGLAVLVNFQHVAADTHSIRQLMREWGAAMRAMLAGQSPPVPTPHEYGRAWFDKLVASAPPAASPVDASVGPHGSAWVRVPFDVRPPGPPPSGKIVIVYVSRARLQELKAEATEQLKASGSPVAFVSSNDALLARMRQVLGRLSCRGPSRPTVTNMAVEMRMRLRLPGQPDTPLCSETFVGNVVRAGQVEEAHDPTVADLGAMAAAARITINGNNDAALAEAAWAAQVEREHGISTWLEYVFGKVDLFGPFPDFSISNWEYSGSNLDFGSGPAQWIQGWVTIPEVGMIAPALHPNYEGGVFVSLVLPDAAMAEFRKLPNPI